MNNNRIDFFTKEEEEKILNFLGEFCRSESVYMCPIPQYVDTHLVGIMIYFKWTCMSFTFFDNYADIPIFEFVWCELTEYIKKNDFESFKNDFKGFYYTWLGITTTAKICQTKGMTSYDIILTKTNRPLTTFVYNKSGWVIEIKFNSANEYHIEEKLKKDKGMVTFCIDTDSIEQIEPICKKLFKRVIFNR